MTMKTLRQSTYKQFILIFAAKGNNYIYRFLRVITIASPKA